jgi:pSer/pThr/pTyr-binding forkhead associated (FHA) protein
MSSGSAKPRAVLVGLTPEARGALGATELPITTFPFRMGRDSRGERRMATRTITDRRKPANRPNNDLYLTERDEPFNVSREHLQIDHNGTDYVLIDRQSSGGTIVEGTVVGGRNAGGAVRLCDGDVIIVGSSSSRYIFKFRVS